MLRTHCSPARKHHVPAAACLALLGCTTLAYAADPVVEGTETASGADAGRLAIRYRCEGLDCNFEAVLDSQLSDEAVDFRWEFSDGSVVTASDPIATHAFAEAGSRSVALSVQDLYCDLFVAEAQFSLLAAPVDLAGAEVPSAPSADGDGTWAGGEASVSETAALTSAAVGYSLGAGRSGRQPLQGAVVSGDVFVFVDTLPDDVGSVRFTLVDAGSGSLVREHVERFVPFDLMGGSVDRAVPLDTRALADARYRLGAAVAYKDGRTESASVDFRVQNVDVTLEDGGTMGGAGSRSTLPELALGTTDPNDYGYRFEGVNGHREALEMRFAGSSSDLVLDLTGFDIDIKTEVRAFVNGTPIGYLARTDDNGRGPSRLEIPASALSASGNTLRFEPRTPGWRWGVTDLRLSVSGGGGGA